MLTYAPAVYIGEHGPVQRLKGTDDSTKEHVYWLQDVYPDYRGDVPMHS